MVLARDQSTRLLDGLFYLWTGKKKLKKLIYFLRILLVGFLGFYEVLYVFLNIWPKKFIYFFGLVNSQSWLRP